MQTHHHTENLATVTALSASYLPADQPLPPQLVLADAPCPNPVALPRGGINLLFGRSAPLILSQATRLALARGFQPVHATVTLRFRAAGVLTTPTTPLNLADTDILLLELNYASDGIDALVGEHLDRMVGKSRPADDRKRRKAAFLRVSAEPRLIEAVLEIPQFRHLKAVVYTVPASKQGSAARFLYVRDLAAIQRIRSTAPECAFIPPGREDLAGGAAPYNPFHAVAAPATAPTARPRAPDPHGV